MTATRKTWWTAKELAETEFPPAKFAVPDLLAEGLNLLAGSPKVGKSWLALGLAVAVASGGRALGAIPVERGDVIYLSLEDTDRRLKTRLLSVLQGDPVPEGLNFATGWRSIPDGGAKDLDAVIGGMPNCRLVVVDVLAKVRGRSSERGNRYDDDYAAVSALKTVADRHSIAMLVLHHDRKADAEDFVATVSGTYGIVGAADAVLVMQRARNSAEARLHLTGRDIEESTRALKFDSTVGIWTQLDGPASDYDLTDGRRRVLNLLRDAARPMTPKEIALALGESYENVKKLVQRMHDKRQLDADSGRYFPPKPPVPHVPPVPVGDTGDRRDTPMQGPFDEADRCSECGTVSLLGEDRRCLGACPVTS
jgi:DNA-binding CsgD family transcriptional regulator